VGATSSGEAEEVPPDDVPRPGRAGGLQSGRADLWLFSVARDLVTGFFPANQAVRAAAYRMLASVDGMKMIRSVKAPDGTRHWHRDHGDGYQPIRVFADHGQTGSGEALATEPQLEPLHGDHRWYDLGDLRLIF
jgi:hypothetical protein